MQTGRSCAFDLFHGRVINKVINLSRRLELSVAKLELLVSIKPYNFGLVLNFI